MSENRVPSCARMRRDHHPYWYEKLAERWNQRFAEHFVYPNFDSLGVEPRFVGGNHMFVRGPHISAGDHFHCYSTRHDPISLAVDPFEGGAGHIAFGSYVILSPGVRMRSASSIRIGDNCMLAEQTFITDADWHDQYHRIYPGKSAPVVLENNVWIGDRVTICKGVTIGENSIIGAASVVTKSIPKNTVAAGNPARPVGELDPAHAITRRDALFVHGLPYTEFKDQFDRKRLAGNSLSSWLRALLFPTRKM